LITNKKWKSGKEGSVRGRDVAKKISTPKIGGASQKRSRGREGEYYRHYRGPEKMINSFVIGEWNTHRGSRERRSLSQGEKKKVNLDRSVFVERIKSQGGPAIQRETRRSENTSRRKMGPACEQGRERPSGQCCPKGRGRKET